jgi:hypothetical protein
MHLEQDHNRAIREEIGDRLKTWFSREEKAVPAHLQRLLRRFLAADRHPDSRAHSFRHFRAFFRGQGDPTFSR